ncbi:hypothetical protein B0H13DRAFT_2661550 [Mycena leptocephala]|nr:hypothetical protein B0H13DRAFT_2661550 [Mycena leptocephala]
MNDPDTPNANDTNGDADRPQIDSGNETNDSGKETKNEEPEAGKTAPASSGFFGWVSPAVRNPRLLKTWIRSVLTVAASMVLLVDSATLRTMGQAGFFASARPKRIVSVLLPPSLALSVFVLASVALLLGAPLEHLLTNGYAFSRPALAMFFVGTFGVGVLRVSMPKLALMGSFSALVESG